MTGSIGERVKARLGQTCPGRPHRQVADEVGMTPDAFSRALNGRRSFSSIELARIADLTDADIHWLITGEPDPHRLLVAARHNFDHDTGNRHVPGREDDDVVLRDIALAYQQAQLRDRPALAKLPRQPERIREELGDGFVRPLADRLESRLGVDVVRVAELSTAYSFSIAGRRVIAVAATGNWFWENWSIAHELGHLVLQHHDDGIPRRQWDRHEAAANAFAAELLLPTEQIRAIDWVGMDENGLAALVWDAGVSTDALIRRLTSLGVETAPHIERWATQPTQRLLRQHWRGEGYVDQITQRMEQATTRRFPLWLQERHLELIASGVLGKGTLAWMLGIHADALDVDAPPPPESVDSDVLADTLGL